MNCGLNGIMLVIKLVLVYFRIQYILGLSFLDKDAFISPNFAIVHKCIDEDVIQCISIKYRRGVKVKGETSSRKRM